MAYIEIRFTGITKETGEILVALLSELEYEGFEEMETGLKAFIPKPLFHKESLDSVAGRTGTSYTITELSDTNWNTAWESNFDPVVVEAFMDLKDLSI